MKNSGNNQINSREKTNPVFFSWDFKLLLWFLISLVLSAIFFRDFWTGLPALLSPDYLFQYHVAPWGVLVLCLLFVVVKRKQIMAEARFKITNVRYLGYILGVAAIAGAVLMPYSQDYIVFQVLLASLGVFIIIFGRGARIPAIMLAIYGFVIAFPMAVEKIAANAYAYSALVPLLKMVNALGYGVQNNGQLITFTSAGGEPISALVTVSCAGIATMGVFIALFTLMMLDRPLPPRKAAGMFLFGAVGTWLQSLIRLVILMVAGYNLGSDALWTAHYWTIYIIFPLWYLLFAFIYFRQLRRPPERGEKMGMEYKLVMGR